MEAANTSVDAVHAFLVKALIAEGFDLKLSDLQSGVATTEWRQVGREVGSPPFDHYLQLRCVVAETDNAGVRITVAPAARSVNRLNPAAFTDEVGARYSGPDAGGENIYARDPEALETTRLIKSLVSRTAAAYRFDESRALYHLVRVTYRVAPPVALGDP